MKTIVVSNHKGGVGKTAISVHLAQYLEEQAKTVLVIDLDGQGNTSKTLAQYASGISGMQLFDGSAPKVIQEQGITLIEADHKLSDLEQAPKQQVLPALRTVLPIISEDFDYCVIDTPPGAGLRVSAALIAAQFVLSPVELDDYSIDGIKQMLQTIFGIKKQFNPDLAFLGMLPNRLNAHSVAQKRALEELLSRYAQFMVPAKIGNRSSVPEALRAGVPVWRLKKSSAKDAGHEMLAAFKIISERIGV
jgi:chromosome partitioning protein